MKNLDRELSDAPKIIKIRSETTKLQPHKVGENIEIFGIWRIFVLEIPDFHRKTVSKTKICWKINDFEKKLSIFFLAQFWSDYYENWHALSSSKMQYWKKIFFRNFDFFLLFWSFFVFFQRFQQILMVVNKNMIWKSRKTQNFQKIFIFSEKVELL